MGTGSRDMSTLSRYSDSLGLADAVPSRYSDSLGLADAVPSRYSDSLGNELILDSILTAVQEWKAADEEMVKDVQKDADDLVDEIETIDKCKLMCETSSDSVKEVLQTTVTTLIEESTETIEKSCAGLKDLAASLPAKMDSLPLPKPEELQHKVDEMDTSHDENLEKFRNSIEEWTETLADNHHNDGAQYPDKLKKQLDNAEEE